MNNRASIAVLATFLALQPVPSNAENWEEVEQDMGMISRILAVFGFGVPPGSKRGNVAIPDDVQQKLAVIASSDDKFEVGRELIKGLPTTVGIPLLAEVDNLREEHLYSKKRIAEAYDFKVRSAGDRSAHAVPNIAAKITRQPRSETVMREAVNQLSNTMGLR